MKERKLTTAQIAFLMAFLTALSKVLGFAREMVLANYFGAGMVMDAYVMSQSIPNSLLAAVISAVGITYMPSFSKKEEQEGSLQADLFTSKVINLQFLLIAIVVFFGIIFAKPIIKFFAPGFNTDTADLTVFYLRFAFFQLFFNVLTYILGAWLNYKGIFLPQTIISNIQNFLIIAGVVVFSMLDYHFLIFSSLIGMTFAGFSYGVLAKKQGFSYSFDFKLDSSAKTVLSLAIPVFIGGYVNQINLAIDKMLASSLSEGCVSALNYANQIINSISALTVAIFVTILYPKLTQSYVKGDFSRMSSLSERGIRLIWVIACPLSLGLVCYAEDVIQILFERGAFDAKATSLTSGALIWYSVGLAFISINLLITKIYYSMNDTKTAVKCSSISVILNIILNFLLVKPMGHEGLAFATSIAAAANTLLLGYTFTRRYPKIHLLSSYKALIKMTIFSFVTIIASKFLYSLIGSSLLKLMLSAGLAVIAYLILLVLFKFEEIELLKELVNRKK